MKVIDACLFAAALAGCAHHQGPKVPPDTAVGLPYAGGTKQTPPVGSCTSSVQCRPGQVCLNRTCISDKETLACVNVRVQFEYDSAEISPADRAQLARAADCLRQHRATKVNIEGNTDERGTEAYNVALGDRRARSVAEYLEKLGASPDQLKTVSYGKENPECSGHDEACWSKNRRTAVKPANK